MKRIVTILIALAVTAGAPVYALWNVDLAALFQVFARANYWILAPLLAAIAVHYWLKAARWAYILHPLGRITSIQVLPAMMIGFAANDILPGHLGEVLRALAFSRQSNTPLSGVFVSQALERLVDVLCILAFYFCATALTPKSPAIIEISAWFAAGAMVVACCAVAAVALRPSAFLTFWHVVSRRLAAGLGRRSDKIIDDMVLAIGAVRSVRIVVLVLINSAAQWAAIVFAVWLSARASGVAISPALSVIVLTFTVLAITIPSAPGYVGAIQAAFVLALTPFGVPHEAAFAASVFFHVAQWIPVTAAGIASVYFLGLHPSRLRGDVEEAKRGPSPPFAVITGYVTPISNPSWSCPIVGGNSFSA